MSMGPVEASMEFGNLALGLMSVFQGRRHNVGHTGGGTMIAGKGGVEVIVGALKEIFKSYGIGHYDETEVSKLFYTGLTSEERQLWTALLAQLSEEERKTLNLIIYLMQRDVEIHEVPAKKADGSVDKERPPTKVTKPVGEDVRLKFMKEIAADVKAFGDEGPQKVAAMLRANEYIGESSAIKRYQATLKRVIDQIGAFLERIQTESATPVPMNLFTRITRAGVVGPKLKNPEPLLQGDGASNAIKRMLGMRTRRN